MVRCIFHKDTLSLQDHQPLTPSPPLSLHCKDREFPRNFDVVPKSVIYTMKLRLWLAIFPEVIPADYLLFKNIVLYSIYHSWCFCCTWWQAEPINHSVTLNSWNNYSLIHLTLTLDLQSNLAHKMMIPTTQSMLGCGLCQTSSRLMTLTVVRGQRSPGMRARWFWLEEMS